ncbi:hypothetical protein JR316_0011605 [Psilocybe cubensis]|uniref:Uncharacterized protein n=2 Tax=Psilocybe cubensis TaxID=181762 RepID=A0ACB8GLE6_PSICU|nr:hypothetical protein JR316_0011605 [Psilocybe cubensis]KAH9476036.1 hypothetical protein JR316_0011605 [Psilocybe cubensis]
MVQFNASIRSTEARPSTFADVHRTSRRDSIANKARQLNVERRTLYEPPQAAKRFVHMQLHGQCPHPGEIGNPGWRNVFKDVTRLKILALSSFLLPARLLDAVEFMYRGAVIPHASGSSSLPPRVPAPSYRHGAPSGPWPYLDIEDQVDPTRIQDPDSHIPLSASPCDHKQTSGQDVCWCKYPQSLYPNWALRQQQKSRIANFVEKQKGDCTIYYLDVMDNGTFVKRDEREVTEKTLDENWIAIHHGRPPGVQVRALFVEGLSGSVLRMLGTHYNIEPFFFSSTLGWIPSRHQTHLAVVKDITVTLTFVRSLSNPNTAVPSPEPNEDYLANINDLSRGELPDLVIDTQAPLPLRSSDILLLPDQLALHMIRSPAGNTIISLHQTQEHRATTAKALHTRARLTGRSVYWSNIFKDSNDPTFVFISLLWYALYAWDETLENVYNHICFLESIVMTTHDIHMTNELHVIRAHLLHYESLLEEFRRTVHFIQHTQNPALRSPAGTPVSEEFDTMKAHGAMLMKRECGNLLTDIDRLERSRQMQAKRLKNVMDLGFSSVNIEDSKRMQKLTESAVNDSAAMKIIAYLTMAFLPASFVAAVFGMNVREINPDGNVDLPHYIAAAIPLTAVTIWIIVAYQIQITEPQMRNAAAEAAGLPNEESKYAFYRFGKHSGRNSDEKQLDIWARLWWPVILISSMTNQMKRKWKERRTQTRIDTIQVKM